MEKKTYLIPTTTVYALYQEDGILFDGSARGKLLFDDGGNDLVGNQTTLADDAFHLEAKFGFGSDFLAEDLTCGDIG